MSKEKEQEKLFSEGVDRLLSGQEGQSNVGMGQDVNSALDFAKKMTVLRITPSPQFSAHLKAKLLRDLNLKEAGSQKEEKRDWFSWLVLHKPVWQSATAVFVVMIIAGIIWASGVFDTGNVQVVLAPTPVLPAGTLPPAATSALTIPGTTQPLITTASVAPTATKPLPATTGIATAPATTRPAATSAPTYIQGTLLAAGASTDKAVYLSGESVKIDCTLRNISLQPLKLERLPPTVSLMQTGTRQPVYTFRAGTDSRTLLSGEKVSYTLTWNQLDFTNRQVSNGSYYLELEDLDYQGKAVQLYLSTPVQFDILPAETAANNLSTYSVNRSQNAGGITILLQKVELSYRSLNIYAFVTPGLYCYAGLVRFDSCQRLYRSD
jgi:hypothetical protein